MSQGELKDRLSGSLQVQLLEPSTVPSAGPARESLDRSPSPAGAARWNELRMLAHIGDRGCGRGRRLRRGNRVSEYS
jgi:hypothetical protein